MKLHYRARLHSIVRTAPLALLALAVLLYAVYFSYLTILRYQAFEARALDMGNLHQAIWNTAHGNWFRMTNQEAGLTSRLSMHVEPILLPIAGIYRLFPGVETLLILQATVVALGAVPLFALARRLRLGDWPALAFGIAYLLNPTVQAANWLEFHPVTLAPTFLMAAFYFLVARTPRGTLWFALFAILGAACKEEIGLLVAMMGLYAALVQRRWRFGLITIVLGAGWSLLAVLGIQAAFAGGNIHWGRYGYLGDTTQAKVVSLLTRPDLIAAQLQAANVGGYFFELLLPVGFLSLLAPEILLLALPSLAINLLAQFSPMHQVTTLIYAAPILPFVMLSAVKGAARLTGWLTSSRAISSRTILPAAIVCWVLGFALVGQRLYGYLPGSGNAMALTVTDHNRRSQVVFDQIPPGASVSAQDRLNPHVAGRKTVYIYPRVDDADYVLLDVTGSAWPQHPNDLKQSVDELRQQGFGIAAADDGYLLLSRNTSSQAIGPEFYTAWQNSPTGAAAIPSEAEFGGVLRLDDYQVRSDRNGELVVDLHWTALEPIAEDLRFYVGYFASKGQALQDNIYYQPVSVLWYPTSMWPQGQRTFVQTLPWSLDADQFTLGVGVYAGEDGWTGGARLPVTAAGGTPVLEDGTLLRLGGFVRTPEGQWQQQPAVPDAYAAQPAQGAAAQYGDAIVLSEFSAPPTAQASKSVPLHLQWMRTAAAPPNLSRFVHVVDAAGNKVAQVDGQVTDAYGPLPVASWPENTAVDDLMILDLPVNLPPGEYTLIAGLYDWQSGERLPANGAAARPDGAAQLGTIRIVE
ncbi:MAG: DUF2079 domain-containing protein [Caldilineaceae bacterium]